MIALSESYHLSDYSRRVGLNNEVAKRRTNLIAFMGSPLAVVKAAATLPGVHTKHEIIQNINKQEQLKDRTTYILKWHT